MIREGEILDASNKMVGQISSRQPRPTSAEQMKLPDPSISIDCRAISALRRIHLGWGADQFFPVVTPMVAQIAQRIRKLQDVYQPEPLQI